MNYFQCEFVSQVGSGANGQNNDCGVAAWKMCADAYRNDIPNVDTLYKSLQSYDSYLTISQLLSLSTKWGFVSQFLIAKTQDQLNKELQKGAVIALINQGEYLKAVPDFPKLDNFRGSHFATIGGYTQSGYAVFNPYQKAETFKGPDIIGFDKWFELWGKTSQQDNNPNYGYITMLYEKPIEQPQQKAKVVINAVKVRTSPSTSGTLTGKMLYYGQVVSVFEMTKDSSNNTWIRIGTNEWACAMYQGQIYIQAI